MTELSSCARNFFAERCGVNVIVNPGQQVASDADCIMILGTIHPDGTAAPGLYQYNANTAPTAFGPNGTLMQTLTETLKDCPTADIYICAATPVGTVGSAEVAITGVSTATASGIAYIWVNGQVYSAPFDPAVDSDSILAERLKSVILSDQPYLSITRAGGTLTIETTEEGEVSGFLDVRGSYSCLPQLVTSSEIDVAITVTSGTGAPDFSALPSKTQGCEFVINPFTDNATMGHVEEYLCQQWSGGASSRAYGVYYGSALNAAAFGLQTNDAKFAYMGIDGALNPPYIASANFGCIAYRRLNCEANDIASSISGEVMPSILSPEPDDLFSNAEQANMIGSGIGYFNVTRAKDVVIGRSVTTYTVADNGTLDNSLADVNKPAIYACISKRMTDSLNAKFTGFTLRTDGVVGGGSRKVTTEEGVENCIITEAQGFSDDNIIQDIPGFIESLVVETDPDTGCVLIKTDPDIPCPLCCINLFLGAG